MEGIENKWWVPQPGDIVRLKDIPPPRSLEAQGRHMAIRELGLKKDKLYEVIDYIQTPEIRGIKIREIKNIQHIAGQRTAQTVRDISGTPSLDFFELAPEYRRSK